MRELLEKLNEISKEIREKEQQLIQLTNELIMLKRNIHDKEIFFERVVSENQSLKNERQRKVYKHNLITEDYDYRTMINKQDKLANQIENLKSEIFFLKREFKIITLTIETTNKEI